MYIILYVIIFCMCVCVRGGGTHGDFFVFERGIRNLRFLDSLVAYAPYTVSSRKRAHYGMLTHPPPPQFWLNFLLRSKVYSNMRPYVATLEHACAITIKWAWLRSLAVHDHSFEAETRHKTSCTAIWQVIFRSYLDYLKCSPHKPAI